MDQPPLSAEKDSLIRGELDPSERLLWSGEPAPLSSMPANLWLPVAIVIPALAMPLLMFLLLAGGLANPNVPAPPIDWIAVIALLVPMALAFLLGPYWLFRRLRSAIARTAYAISDQRVLLFDGGYRGVVWPALAFSLRSSPKELKVQSFRGDDITDLERRQLPDGSGDILFGRALVVAHATQGEVAALPRAGFYSIPDVKRVEELLRALQGNG